MAEFTDSVVLVTGGTRGIGRACAAAFARAGARVAVCGRNAQSATEAAEAIASETGGSVTGFQADIAKSEEVNALVDAVTEALGPIRVLVNNAGIARDGLVMRMKNEAWDDVLRTNLDGTFYCCRAVARGMMKQRYGRMINISSIVGLRGQGGQSNYAAAKAGIVGFSKALAQELAPRNVTVNVVAPGYIKTDMTAGFSEAIHEKLVEQIPAGREGSPDEVASAILFLAGENAGYITGHVLCVDGGLGM
ncbi:MAG: 3-oxoacyl-[acyl-carrier-protein] reductase [Candidatus Hydrogenedentes bacterium]|nr:3-oxoacyl-[acyl-carrier-protein] reductase [Candidatus Hydrogenedentota bacterium]